jgi:predicted AlkP superfamily phosphohydrolase/phosphomutase
LSKQKFEAVAYKLGLGTPLKTMLSAAWKDVLPSAPTTRLDRIDWGRTKAFFASLSNQSIRINLAGREEQGTVGPGPEYEAVRQQIMDALMSLTDPETGQPAVQSVHRREEVYHGDLVEQADDLIVCAEPGHYLVAEPGRANISKPDEDRFAWSGTHRREGTVIWAGPGIKRGQGLGPLPIEDIAPTVLHLTGLPVPEYMDGRVMTSALEPAFLTEHPVRMSAGPLPSCASVPTDERADEEQITARLRSIGYIE